MAKSRKRKTPQKKPYDKRIKTVEIKLTTVKDDEYDLYEISSHFTNAMDNDYKEPIGKRRKTKYGNVNRKSGGIAVSNSTKHTKFPK